MLSQSDKVTVTKYPALPSLCRVCNFSADAEREFVDFQLSFDYEGAVNICSFCMANVVQALGYIDPTEVQSLMDRNTELVERCNELKAENDKLNSGLDTVLGLRPDLVHRDLSVDADTDSNSGKGTHKFELSVGDSVSIESDTDSGNESEDSGLDEPDDSDFIRRFSGDDGSDASGGFEDTPLFASESWEPESD